MTDGTRRISGALCAHNLRRVLAATVMGALALALLAGGRPVSDAHAATTCTKYSKRVVTHVKRHGKRKKIVRLRPYWTCQEVAPPVAPELPVPAPVATPAPEAPAPQPEPEANAV